MVQVAMNGWDGVDWGDALIAAGVGAAAGAAAPFTGSGYLGATGLGAFAGMGQYGLTQYSNGENTTSGGFAISAVAGAVGGAISGPVTRQTPFDEASRFLDSSIARSLNNSATLAATTSAGNVTRSMGAGVASNVNLDFNTCE